MIQEELLTYQANLLRSTKKFLALIGGTGVGKTFFLPRYLLFKMQEHPNHKWIVCAPTNQMLRANPIAYIMDFFKKIDLPFHYNATFMTLETRLGKVHFISAETPDRMQGIHAKGVVCDEAGMVSRLWWDTAIQRISFNKGQILLITTPYSHNWLKTEVYDEWLSGSADFHVENPTCLENPYYPVEEYARAKRRLPAWKFNMLYNAKFTKIDGLIYEKYSVCEPFAIPDHWPVYRSLDFGYNNPFAVVWAAEDLNNDTIYLFREHKQSGMDIDQIDKLLKNDRYSKAVTYADPENQEVMNTLKRRGANIRPSKKAVMPGILLTAEKFKIGKLVVFNTMKLVIDELDTYQWESDAAGGFIDKPKKYNDHLMDAVRYMIYTKEKKRSRFYSEKEGRG